MNGPKTVAGRMLAAFLRGLLPETHQFDAQIADIEAEAALDPDTDCATCKDNGLVIDRAAGTWDLCPKDCQTSKDFDAALRKGEADIAAGRFSKLSDIRREA